MYKIFVIILFIILGNVFAQENIKINELLASNINGLVDNKSGEFVDWIELYNPSDTAVNLTGYFLADQPVDAELWEMPANTVIEGKEFLILFADGQNFDLHTSFKLSADGEHLFLFSPDTIIIDSVSYPKQRTDVSYGRSLTNEDEWLYFSLPTPDDSNKTNGVSSNKLSDPPTFSQNSGFYSSIIDVELSSQDSGQIYYTLDGSLPNISSFVYDIPISIDSTVVVRAVFVENDKLPSRVITKTYLINENTQLPVISLTTDPQNLWDDERGIYTVGTNGLSLWGVKANYWQEWERPINIEFFEENKIPVFNVNAGIAINGARRNMSHKSMRIFMRSKYGDESINYKIFPDKEIREFTSLVLRNGGYPEFSSTLFKDGFIQTLISQHMDIEYQAYRPAIVMVNGKYWGIYNIREKQNEEYLRDNKGVDPDNLDILENNMSVVEGDRNHYENMINFISENDLSINSNYDTVKTWIDIDNYINYLITQLYIANNDWPGNNIKYWRPRIPDGKWRWMVFDVDGGFGLWAKYDFNSIEFATAENSTEWNNAPWSTFLFRNMLKNKEFRDEFIQRFALYLSSAFAPNRVNNLINVFQKRIENEMQRHIDRWSPGCSPDIPEMKDGCIFDNIETWYSMIDVLKEFSNKRPNNLMTHIMNYFGKNDTVKIMFEINNNNFGYLNINNVKINQSFTANLFTDTKIRIEAIPLPGYKFSSWSGSIRGTSKSLVITPTFGMNLTANFEPIEENAIPSAISEDLVLEYNGKPYSAAGDIYIYENSTMTIEKGVEILMPANSNLIVFGSLQIEGTEHNPVKISPKLENETWGSIIFENTTEKSILSYVNITGTTRGIDKLTHIGGISSINSVLEMDHIQMYQVNYPIYVEYGNFRLSNSKIQSDVTCDLVNVKYGRTVIENCEFIGGYAVDTDAIDYDNVPYGVIRRNKIHGFYGSNSDGIDIGEGARNVIIEENLIYNCTDKGISIGQGSSAIIKGNTIVNCNLGIGIKDDLSYGEIDHNTFHNNYIAVSCFEKIESRGGGKAFITNSIFSASQSIDIFSDEYSEIIVNYSISTRTLLDGEGNLFGDPEFIDADLMNFGLLPSSIAIDSGDPTFIYDADGTRTNIGASYSPIFKKEVIITEINYHSSPDHNTQDWIELYNPAEESIDLSNWIFKDSNDDHKYIFPEGTYLQGNSFIILAEDTNDFNSYVNDNIKAFGNFNFGLNNAGEHIRLFDNYGNVVDSLTYDDEAPWPANADGEGFTLQLLDPSTDNSIFENWGTSVLYGTPGKNNITVDVENDDQFVPKYFALYQNYPNPFNSQTTIKFAIPNKEKVIIKLYDILGNEVKTLFNKSVNIGEHQISINSNDLASGVYFYRIQAGTYLHTRKMILLK